MENPLSRLHRLIVERLTLAEVETLCFDLGVNYDDLPGDTLSTKARELILALGRRRTLESLLTALLRNRPDLSGEPALRSDRESVEVMYRALPAFHSPPAVPARRRGAGRVVGAILTLLVLAGAAIVAVRWDELVGGTPGTTATTTTAPSEAPRAAPIDNTVTTLLHDEQTLLLTIPSGGEAGLDVMSLWSAPLGAEPSCASAFLVFTWQVREPYPGGDELEIRRTIPMGGGRTEVLADGASGQLSVGWCDEVTFANPSLEEVRVEVRYASGLG